MMIARRLGTLRRTVFQTPRRRSFSASRQLLGSIGLCRIGLRGNVDLPIGAAVLKKLLVSEGPLRRPRNEDGQIQTLVKHDAR